MSKINYTEEELQQLAESILCDIDYKWDGHVWKDTEFVDIESEEEVTIVKRVFKREE